MKANPNVNVGDLTRFSSFMNILFAQVCGIAACLLICACGALPSASICRNVSNAIAFSEEFRDNPDNEGGNENVFYEPREYYAGEEPVWMRRPDLADECLILLAARDAGFNESNWISFFHGLPQNKISMVRKKVLNVTPMDYRRILKICSEGETLQYTDFISRVESFRGAKLESMKRGEQAAASGGDKPPI